MLAAVGYAVAMLFPIMALAAMTMRWMRRRRQRREIAYEATALAHYAMTASAIRQAVLFLPVHLQSDGNPAGECSVCLSDLSLGEEVRELP